jgi:hypothetical protein
MRICSGRSLRHLIVAAIVVPFFGSLAHAQGACPANVPATGNNCYFIAASGSDTNNGTSESTPWLHAPGMPSCSSKCAGVTPKAGQGFIFRGTDTWHFLNSSANPYTGGTWAWTWAGTTPCDVYGLGNATSGCIYIGVDKTWYSGSSWARPILTGDNATSTSAVPSCTYPGGIGSQDDMFTNSGNFVIFDSFELTGICQDVASSQGNGYGFGRDEYIRDFTYASAITQNKYSNNYVHGATHLAFSCTEPPGGEPVGVCFSISAFQSGSASMSSLIANVCDFWDSDPTGAGCIQGGPAYYVAQNVFEHQAQIEMGGCHSWHDNLWQYYYPTGDGIAHGNQHECNTDAPQTDSNGHSQTNVSNNVFYNNVVGHNLNTPGDVKIWFCPTAIPEYWFDNVVYDQGSANNFDIDTHDYSCGTMGGQYQFNNTIDVPGAGALNNVASLNANGNHTVVDGGSAWASGSGNIGSKNIQMTHSTAVSQGYMANGTGTSGSNGNVTCANDITPCAPTSSSNSTVGAGVNNMSYCNSLLSDSDPLVQAAGTACKSSTADACAYNTATRTASCPSQTAVARPTSGAWDAGAYQFNPADPPPNAPMGLTATVN